MPDLIAYAFYRFECVLRSSAVLGFFGFPTLGLYIRQSFDSTSYGEVWTYLYVLLALVIVFDSVERRGSAQGTGMKPGAGFPDRRDRSWTNARRRCYRRALWQRAALASRYVRTSLAACACGLMGLAWLAGRIRLGGPGVSPRRARQSEPLPERDPTLSTAGERVGAGSWRGPGRLRSHAPSAAPSAAARDGGHFGARHSIRRTRSALALSLPAARNFARADVFLPPGLCGLRAPRPCSGGRFRRRGRVLA